MRRKRSSQLYNSSKNQRCRHIALSSTLLLKNKKIKIHQFQALQIKEIRAEEAKQGLIKETMIETCNKKEVKTAIKIKRREERIRKRSNIINFPLNLK